MFLPLINTRQSGEQSLCKVFLKIKKKELTAHAMDEQV